MGFGENMPLDVLFVRDDDIPDLVQEDVCDLGLVGLNVLEEKRLELAARGAPARFESLRTLDFGRCRLSLAVPAEHAYDGLRRCGQAHRHHLSVSAGRLPETARHPGRDRHALRRGGNRAAPGARRSDLRSGVHRLDAAGQSPARSGNRAGESRGADPYAGAAGARTRTNGSNACCCASKAWSR